MDMTPSAGTLSILAINSGLPRRKWIKGALVLSGPNIFLSANK